MEAEQGLPDVIAPPRLGGMLRREVRPWMLALGSTTWLTPLRLGLISLVVLIPPTWWAGSPLINPFLIAYAVGIVLHLVERQGSELRQLEPLLEPPANDVVSLGERLWYHPRSWIWLCWLIGPALMLGVNAPSDLAATIFAGGSIGLAGAWSVICASLFWAIFLQVMVIMSRNSLLFHRLGARHVRIDLLDVRGLTPFARVAVRNFLIFMGGLTLAPLQLLQATSYLPQLMLAMAASLPFCLALVMLPVWSVHVRLAEAKRAEFDRVQRALRGDAGALAGSPIEGDADRLTVTNLVLYRDMIRGMSEWPVDAPAVLRFVTYVVIPLSAWVGAAIVQHWVEALF